MAQMSKGNKKKHSTLQKAHYKAYALVNKRLSNKIKRLQRRIRRNAAEIKRKATRTPPRYIKVDQGAIDALALVIKATK